MATLKDVAERAGLSVTTVSRILNNRGYISDEARERVREAMRELNYHPNALARSLQKQHSSMIALIVPHIRHPFFAVLISELEESIRSKGYQILLFNTKRSDSMLQQYLDICEQNRVAGIILCSSTIDERVLDRLNAPIVTIERYVANGASCITCDNYNGGRMAAEILIRGGSRRLLYVGCESHIPMPADLRERGLLDVCRERNIPCSSLQIPEKFEAEPEQEQYLEKGFIQFRNGGDSFDGIFTSGDMLAANAIHVLHKMKKRVPEDVQIIGFDDTLASRITTPAISTIRQPAREMAIRAAEEMVKTIEGEQADSSVVLPVTYIARETTRRA